MLYYLLSGSSFPRRRALDVRIEASWWFGDGNWKGSWARTERRRFGKGCVVRLASTKSQRNNWCGRSVAKPGTDVVLAGAEQCGAVSCPTALSVLGENLRKETQGKLLALFVSPSSTVTFIPAQIYRGL